jgi:diguanylate cyclase (GGDEF)-like protein
MTNPQTHDEAFDGLFSQTQIRHLMKTEFGRAKRYDYDLSCIMLEISGIGAFRDHFGFDAKEDLCSDFVSLLRAVTRSCDYLGRMMDDRFLAVLPHTALPGTSVLVNRLQERLSDIELPDGAADTPLHLTCGSAHFSDGSPMFFDALLDGAQAALLAADPGTHKIQES